MAIDWLSVGELRKQVNIVSLLEREVQIQGGEGQELE